MATYVIPFRSNGKTRLGDSDLAQAMLDDVIEACRAAGADEVVVIGEAGGQGAAVAHALAGQRGPVTIVNADLPCATAEELRQLTAAAPAIAPAEDGTTNAIALRDAGDFVPLYGSGSAGRYESVLQARSLDLNGLRQDIDTWSDLERVREAVGRRTRTYLQRRA